MHELPEYLGYDIKKLKNNVRFLEVVINRDGQSNGMIGLYFDGSCNFYAELPPPTDTQELQHVYELIEKNKKSKSNRIFFRYMINKVKKLWQMS